MPVETRAGDALTDPVRGGVLLDRQDEASFDRPRGMRRDTHPCDPHHRQTQVRPDIGWWRETAQAPPAFEAVLAASGLQRLAPGAGKATAVPQLWRCTGM